MDLKYSCPRRTRKIAVLLFLLMLATSPVQALVRIVFVVEHELTHEPIAGATIELVEESRSGVTDESGQAVFASVRPGRYRVLIEKEGYLPYFQRIIIDNSKDLKFHFILTPQATIEDQITVVAGPYQAGTREISASEVATLAGAGEDPFKAMTRTPGILTPAEEDSRLYIRGSPPSENLILLDDVPIYDPYRIYGLVTQFDPATVSYFSIWPGGFPARYGNRLSAVVEIYNRYGTTEKTFSGAFNTSFTNSSLLAEGSFPLSTGQASWMLTARRTYYDIVLNAMNSSMSQFPYFFDVQARLYYQPTSNHEFSLFSILSHEGTDMSEEFETEYTTVDFEAVDDQDAQVYGFHHYFHVSSQTLLTTVMSYYTNQQQTDASIIIGDEAFKSEIVLDLDTTELMLQEKLEFELGQQHVVEAGVLVAQNDALSMLSFVTDDPAITIPPELAHFKAESDNRKFGLYIQDQWELTRKISLNPGVRFDYGSISGFQRLSPRFNFTYKLNETQKIKGSWGIYYQFPSYEGLQGDGLLYDLENIDELDLDPEVANHYLLGFQDELPGSYTWSIEIYHKELRDLIVGHDVEMDVLVLNEDQTTSIRSVTTSGIEPYNGEKGYARGLELLFQKDQLWHNRLSFQVSYALAETRAHKNGEKWHFRRYDQTHSLNVLGNLSLGKKWDIAFVWRYGSGFPYTPLGEIVTTVEDINGNGQYDPRAGERLSYLEIEDPDQENSQRYPIYHRLDARVNYYTEWKLCDATFYLDILNLYDRENIQSFEYSKDYSERTEVSGMPFLPTFGVHLTF
ncbi:TonB-dependent receptor [bacterium]|nr:TonB-dependent receptor [bacterium]